MTAESKKFTAYRALKYQLSLHKARLENDAQFLRWIAKARKSLRAGPGGRLEDGK
jgi:hypothetical protein